MYFAGEPLNETDRFLATVTANRERLIVPFRSVAEPQTDGLLVGVWWDIVLDQGWRRRRGPSAGPRRRRGPPTFASYRAPSHVTRGFQSTYVPFGLSRHAQTWSSYNPGSR